jgi:DNA repair ATPase RecN
VLDVFPLTGADRLQEVARLLGGEKGGGADRQEQLAYARQLLAGVGKMTGSA